MKWTTQFELAPEHERLLGIANELVPAFAARARQYDEQNLPHKENFQEIHAAGLLGATVPQSCGGLGLGLPDRADPLPYWLLTKSFARADLALARNWENHCNMVETIAVVGTPAQMADFGARVVETGTVICQWSAEPPARAAAEGAPPPATAAEKVPGGWLLNGVKRYANSARLGDIASIWMQMAGSYSFLDGMVMLMTPVRRPEITIDSTWWDSMGMRAADAQTVHIENLFVPDADQIGEPGAFVRARLMTIRAVPHHAVSFLGAAEAVYDWIVDYLKKAGKQKDPHVQRHVGEMRAALETANAFLAQLARTWTRGSSSSIRLASLTFRHVVEHAALSVVDHAIRAAGSTIFLRSYPFEKFFRDLHVYVRHENDDKLASAIGGISLDAQGDTFWTPAQARDEDAATQEEHDAARNRAEPAIA